MTKKLLAVLLAVCVMLTACVFALADNTGDAESPTDVAITVTFDANVSGSGEMEPIVVGADGKVTIPECGFDSQNFNFKGWNTHAEGTGIAYEPGDEITVTESIILYAQWLHKSITDDDWVEYTVTYDANGGEGETIDEWSPYLEGNIAQVVYNEFTYEGRTFKEWNTKADGTGTSYQPDDTFDITSDVVLYAIWEGGEDEVPETPIVDEQPKDETPVDDTAPVVTDTNVDDNPDTGDAASVAVALGAGIVALGAFVVLKKKN